MDLEKHYYYGLLQHSETHSPEFGNYIRSVISDGELFVVMLPRSKEKELTTGTGLHALASKCHGDR